MVSAVTTCPEAVGVHSRAMEQVWMDQGRIAEAFLGKCHLS